MILSCNARAGLPLFCSIASRIRLLGAGQISFCQKTVCPKRLHKGNLSKCAPCLIGLKCNFVVVVNFNECVACRVIFTIYIQIQPFYNDVKQSIFLHSEGESRLVRHFSFKINSLSLSLLAAHFAAERFFQQ